MLRTAVTMMVAVLAAACAQSAAMPQPHLDVSRSGEAIAIQTALVTDEGNQALKLFFSSATPTCEEIQAPSRRLASGEVSFTLTRSTWADGTSDWMVYYGGFTTNAPEGTEIEIDQLDATEGARSSGRIKAVLEGAREGDEIRIDGTFEAIGCGAE